MSATVLARPAILVLATAFCAAAFGEPPRIKNIKIAVENPTGESRPGSNVVLQISDIKKLAPDFTPGSEIVTATEASTVEEDARVLAVTELPSQVDGLERETKADELAFQIDLKPHQTRIVTIPYGEVDRIWRLRSEYPRRTNALFSRKIEGVGWESERNAFRVYFDKRNGIDIYGKRRPSMQLEMFASPEYDYHDESPEGRDVYRVGNAIGVGSIAAILNGKIERVADVKDRQWRIVSAGPVRSIVDLTYTGWNLGGQQLNLKSRITIWAGEYGFTHSISVEGQVPGALITGVPLKSHAPLTRLETSKTAGLSGIATWGEQVVNPGSAEQDFVPGSNIGLAIILPSAEIADVSDDDLNHLVKLNLDAGKASWYVMASWDQNGTNRMTGSGNRIERGSASSYVLPYDGINSREAFLAKVADEAARIATPVRVTILDHSPAPQSAPADTLGAHPAKSYRRAIELLAQQVDRTAQKWQPIISSNSTGSFTSANGKGFFTEGDNESGEWKPNDGFYWTGSFWVGELWKLYASTHDEKYRRWAELWGSRLLGQEMEQNHDAGFLYYYSSATGFDLTHEQKLRESAVHAGGRLAELYNPVTHLISTWEPKGDETIIDTMMNLQLLWWLSHQNNDPRWREIATNHALRSAEWLVRPDGSVIQSVHYNPGDNRQEFDLAGGPSNKRPSLVKISNDAKPGEWVFSHNHQGYSADTSWSRGAGWALYGFAVAAAETHDPKLLAADEKVAEFVLENLPSDSVPWYDMLDEGVHFRNRDSSAGAIMAGGLLRLSELTQDRDRAARYRAAAQRMVESLIDNYLTPVGASDKTPPGVLRHGSSIRPNDGSLIYGQYYLFEDLLWLDAHGIARRTAD
ncbi:MAG TPA: DUF4861 family protein [Candidatus Acidoferrales bacterium]|nr:DUF4861 family protein [Candidatus Acidoferrales bacterium]